MSERLRVALDATPLERRVTGAGRVLLSLLAHLPSVEDAVEVVAIVRPEGVAAAGALPAGTSVVTVDAESTMRMELREVPRAARRAGADVLLTLRESVGFGGPPTVMHVFEPPEYR